MADYKLAEGKEPQFVASMLAFLHTALEGHDGRAVAKWAQDTFGILVTYGVAVPTVHWKVWDTKAQAYADPEYATKDLALAARRELGGNSARYRVERVPLGEAVTE